MCYLCNESKPTLRYDVESGAAVLDELPELEGIDWRKMVRDNADDLDLWSCRWCVLGIVFDSKSTDTYEDPYDAWNYDTGEWESEIHYEEYGSGYNWFIMNYPEYDVSELGFCPGQYSASDLRDAWLGLVDAS